MEGKMIKDFIDAINKHFTNLLNKKEIHNSNTVPEELSHVVNELPSSKYIFSEYLNNKFKYLLLLLQDKKTTKKSFISSGAERKKYKECLNLWNDFAKYEEYAYVSRIKERCQKVICGKCDKTECAVTCDAIRTVHDIWYNKTQGFEEWASFCRTRFRNIYNGLIENNSKYNEIATKSKPDISEEMAYSMAWYDLEEKEKIKNSKFISQNDFDNIFKDVLFKISSGECNDTIISHFLEKIRKVFNCKLCDFLEVRSLNGNEKVVLLYSTARKSILDPTQKTNQDWNDLRDGESYPKGEGITGGILIPPKENKELFSVGTNDLSKDYRLSYKQKEVYQKIYKIKVNNFWAFPIYVDEVLKYVLRVTNRKGTQWSYLERKRIQSLVNFFGMILPKNPQNEDEVFATDLRAHLDLIWIKLDDLKKIIEHLKSVASIYKENRPIGCTILIVPSTILKINGLPKKINIKKLKLPDILKVYEENPAIQNCLVMNKDLNILNCFEYENKDEMEKRLIRYTKDNISVLFKLLKGRKSIQIISAGRYQGEIFLSESDGKWKCRLYQSIIGQIKEKKPTIGDEHSLNLILHFATMLSSQENSSDRGAIIILGKNIDSLIQVIFQKEIIKSERLVKSDNVEDTFYYLPVDPLIFIEHDELKSGESKIIITSAQIQENKLKRHLSKKHALNKFLSHKGRRHLTGAQISLNLRDSMIFIISQNRGITILLNGADKHLSI